jgi:hypothetical protein
MNTTVLKVFIFLSTPFANREKIRANISTTIGLETTPKIRLEKILSVSAEYFM